MKTSTGRLASDTALTPSRHVRAREIGGEAVLVDLEGGVYFGLNEVGTVIWQSVAAGATLGQAHAAVVERFDVEPDRAWSDLVALLRDLLSHGLVTLRATSEDPVAE